MLIHDGRILEGDLRRELMTREELQARLRSQGVVDPNRIDQAVLDVEGRPSVIELEEEDYRSGSEPEDPGAGDAARPVSPVESSDLEQGRNALLRHR